MSMFQGRRECPDATGVGTAPAIRAERIAKGNGRVYRVALTASHNRVGSCTLRQGRSPETETTAKAT